MLEQADQPFGALGGLAGVTPGDGISDAAQLALEGERQPSRTIAHEEVELADRGIEPADLGAGSAAVTGFVERDDLSHGRTVPRGSDIGRTWRGIAAWTTASFGYRLFGHRGSAMRRISMVVTVAIVAAAVVVGTTSAALAGGSSIEPVSVTGGPFGTSPEGPWVAPGSVVTMAGGFCPGARPDPADRSWYAYLTREGSPQLLLGPVSISRVGSGSCELAASVTFTVPPVTSGRVLVSVCEPGCDRGTGDLIGGSLIIAGSRGEAVALARLADAEARVERLTMRADRAELDTGELQATIDELEASMAELEAFLARARSQRDVALDGREVAEADARATDRESRNWRIATYLFALITAITWLVAWGRRRDTIRIRIPSTVEEFETHQDRADH